MPDQDLTLYSYNFRSRGERVMWALNEAGLDYRLVRLNPLKGENRTPNFLALNPGARIPVLVHGDFVLTESLAILDYVAGLAPELELVPHAGHSAHRYREMMCFMQSEIEAYLWISDQSTRLRRIYPWPEGTAESAMARVASNLPRLTEKISGDGYLLGDRFSNADIYAYHLLVWSAANGVDMLPHVHGYLQNLGNRPGCPETIKLPSD